MLRNAFCWRFYSDEEKIRFLLYLVDMCLFVRQTIVFVWYENSILHARHMHIAILLSFTQPRLAITYKVWQKEDCICTIFIHA